MDKKILYNEQIIPLITEITKICEENGIPYAFQFALKTIEKDEKYLMALTCNNMGDANINHVVRAMCRVQDMPLDTSDPAIIEGKIFNGRCLVELPFMFTQGKNANGRQYTSREVYDEAFKEYMTRGGYITIPKPGAKTMTEHVHIDPVDVFGRITEVHEERNSATVDVLNIGKLNGLPVQSLALGMRAVGNFEKGTAIDNLRIISYDIVLNPFNGKNKEEINNG